MNLYIPYFALEGLLTHKGRNIFSFFVLFLLCFMLFGMLFVSSSITKKLLSASDDLPSMIVELKKGSKTQDLQDEFLRRIATISGIRSVHGRIWGKYTYEWPNKTFFIVGVDEFEQNYQKFIDKLKTPALFNTNSMIISDSLKDKLYIENNLTSLVLPSAKSIDVKILGEFPSDLELFTKQMALTSVDLARKVFGMDTNSFSDALVYLANEDELSKVAQKIIRLDPRATITTKQDLQIAYKNHFNYKGGVFLMMFSLSLLTLFILSFYNITKTDEKTDVGLFKTLGWSTQSLIGKKLYEGVIVSFFAFWLGVVFAYLYIYIYNGGIFTQMLIAKNVQLDFNFSLSPIIITFILVVPVYIGSIIVPSWRLASLDVKDALS